MSVYDIERRKISPSWSLLKHTHTRDVRGTGREDHAPARAVAGIEEWGMIGSDQIRQLGAQCDTGSKFTSTNSDEDNGNFFVYHSLKTQEWMVQASAKNTVE